MPVYGSDDPNSWRLKFIRSLKSWTMASEMLVNTKESDGEREDLGEDELAQTSYFDIDSDPKGIADSDSDSCCDFQDIWSQMVSINIDDDHDVELRIAGALAPKERAAIALTAEDESKILAALGALPNEDELGKSNLWPWSTIIDAKPVLSPNRKHF